jgi:hypothetical protein
MADILIRGVPDEVVTALDARAKQLGLTRSAYLRRVLERERADRATPVAVEHFALLAQRTTDLDDPEIMTGAWS